MRTPKLRRELSEVVTVHTLLSRFSHVRLFATVWTVAHQDPLYMDSPGKNTGVGCPALLQGVIPTQELNLGHLHCRQILYQLSYEGNVAEGNPDKC